MRLRLAIFVGILFSLQLPISCAASSDWVFVWVSSGSGGYYTSRGKASVGIQRGKLSAEMADESGVHYKLTGYVVKNRVSAKFTVVGSDYFIDSMFSGSFQTKKRWSKLVKLRGRESIALTDGWNFIGISREIH